MGDDGVGLHVLRRLKQTIPPRSELEFKEASIGGIKLVEEILGYRTVFIIDSIESPTTIGDINEFSPEEFNNTRHESTPHVTNFITALELYKKLEPTRIPERIRIFTIDIDPHYTFSETLSPKIRNAAAKLTEQITREIERTLS
jgi:hydrogenase maturation protease